MARCEIRYLRNGRETVTHGDYAMIGRNENCEKFLDTGVMKIPFQDVISVTYYYKVPQASQHPLCGICPFWNAAKSCCETTYVCTVKAWRA